jgi:hypothetical protein
MKSMKSEVDGEVPKAMPKLNKMTASVKKEVWNV